MVERMSVSRVIFNIFNYLLMIVIAALCLLPMWHVVMASISNPRDLIATAGLVLWPVGEPTWDGYAIVLNNSKVWTGYMNTIIYVIGSGLIGTVLCLIAGYLLSRKNFKLQRPLTMFILFTMLFSGGMIPTYMIIRYLGLLGTRWAIILPGCTNAFYIIMMKSAFDQLPASYEEAALIDGASPMRILIEVLVPLVKATIAVVVMFGVIAQWNSWFPASIYLTTDRDKWPLQLVMKEILISSDISKLLSGADAIPRDDLTGTLVRYSIAMVGTLPILVAYPFAQKFFVKGVTLGGVKG